MVSGRCMKPRKADQQLRSVSLLYFVCAPALKQKPSPLIRRRAWMQAPIEASHGEEWRVFLLGILSHRMASKCEVCNGTGKRPDVVSGSEAPDSDDGRVS